MRSTNRRPAFTQVSPDVPPVAEPGAAGPRISAQMSVGRAALLLGAMVALSRLTGFGRMMVLSQLYGISPLTDAYNAAFNIPDALSILIAGGALATGFVPVFTALLERGQSEAAVRTFRAMWTLLLAAFGTLTLLLLAFSFTPFALKLAPEKVTPEVAQLYLHLLRILLVSTFFFVLGGLFAGTLNAMRHFWYFALQPVAFNGGIILFGIIGPKFFGAGIESQAWGALAGAFVGSILIQVPGLRRHGLSLCPLWDTRDAGVRQVLAGLGPIAFGLASGQIIALVLPRFFAASAQLGDLSALDYANRLVTVPLAVLASGPAIALFPTLVQHHVNNSRMRCGKYLRSRCAARWC
jgi:putative peptidoglycan lipid II flippase